VVVYQAPWLVIVHDLNPRVVTKHVKGFVSAQSWRWDFSTIDMENEDPIATFY